MIGYKPMEKPEVVKVYDYYNDIQPKLCEYMGIEEKYFRSYHKLVGGDYKDMWHVFLWLNDEFKGNDSYFVMYGDGGLPEECIGETANVLKQRAIKYHDEYNKITDQQERDDNLWKKSIAIQIDEYEWAKPLYDALERLHIDYGERLVVWISW